MIIRDAALGEGLAGIAHFDEAATLIQRAMDRLHGFIDPPLDYIDSAAMVVNALERFPLDRRYPLLDRLLPTFVAVAEAVDAGGPFFTLSVFSQLTRLLDQIATAAISRDQLSLAACRAYLLADEYLILQRILTEDPTLSPS